MIFTETKLKGSFVIDLEKLEDERGFFARAYCQREFEEHGIETNWVQCNVSFNKKSGTLRGLHYQETPHGEAKLIRCTMGSIFDVVIDLRLESPTFKHHYSVDLSIWNRRMLYVPVGVAHGFLTLEDNTEIFYHMSEFHAPDYAKGIRWNDTSFNVQWPADVKVISERDRTYPDFIQVTH